MSREQPISATDRIRFYENGEANSYAIMEEPTDGRWLLTLLHNGHDVTERQKANMRRLVACWNACEGIQTEALEQTSVLALLTDAKHRLDDMLKGDDGQAWKEAERFMPRIEAALKNNTGEQQ